MSAEKKSTFSRLSQNETAKECYQLGFFAPQNADAALAALEMMDFEGIEKSAPESAAERHAGTEADSGPDADHAVPREIERRGGKSEHKSIGKEPFRRFAPALLTGEPGSRCCWLASPIRGGVTAGDREVLHEKEAEMIKVNYTELDGPYGPAMRLEAAGHAGYAPAGAGYRVCRCQHPDAGTGQPAGGRGERPQRCF